MDPLRRKTLLGLTSVTGLGLAGGLLGPDGLPLVRGALASEQQRDHDQERDRKDIVTEALLTFLPLLVLSGVRFRINNILLVSLFGMILIPALAGVIARSQNRMRLPLFGGLQRTVYSASDVALVRAVGIILLLNTTMMVLFNPFIRSTDFSKHVALNQDQDFEFQGRPSDPGDQLPEEVAADVAELSKIPLIGRYFANKTLPGDTQIVTELAQGTRQTSVGVPGLDDIPLIKNRMFGQAIPYDHSTLLLHVTPTLVRDHDES